VLDIYAANEKPIPGVSGERLAQHITECGDMKALYLKSFVDAVALVVDTARPGDMIITLGAGSVSQLGPQLLEALEGRTAKSAG
jgi:UDP-N-acetylmuramate--alanine ligase